MDNLYKSAMREQLKQLVRMRDALVHDYLNLDPELISEVIANSHYLKLFAFAFARIDEK